MGEIADMVLEGILCQLCGELMSDDAPGHPRTCDGCLKPIKKHACQFCHKGFTTTGGRDAHEKTVHAKRLANSPSTTR